MEWISAGDGKTLCLSGYPIQIVRLGFSSFELQVEGRPPQPWATLAVAKRLGEEIASEAAEFTVA